MFAIRRRFKKVMPSLLTDIYYAIENDGKLYVTIGGAAIMPKRRTDTARTTVTLPRALLEAADREVRRGAAATRNALIARALRHELAARRRREIDAAYVRFADDAEAMAESLEVAEEFSRADWEAFREGEAEP